MSQMLEHTNSFLKSHLSHKIDIIFKIKSSRVECSLVHVIQMTNYKTHTHNVLTNYKMHVHSYINFTSVLALTYATEKIRRKEKRTD